MSNGGNTTIVWEIGIVFVQHLHGRHGCLHIILVNLSLILGSVGNIVYIYARHLLFLICFSGYFHSPTMVFISPEVKYYSGYYG